jgi:hypothetical protein
MAENSAFLQTRQGQNHTLDHTLARGLDRDELAAMLRWHAQQWQVGAA